jgi:acyl carrier protein
MSQSPAQSSASSEIADLTRYCRTLVAEMLECDPGEIDANAKFSRLGLDSAMSVQLIVALEARLGIELSPDIVADYPTISRLVEHLASPGAGQLAD